MTCTHLAIHSPFNIWAHPLLDVFPSVLRNLHITLQVKLSSTKMATSQRLLYTAVLTFLSVQASIIDGTSFRDPEKRAPYYGGYSLDILNCPSGTLPCDTSSNVGPCCPTGTTCATTGNFCCPTCEYFLLGQEWKYYFKR
jgi:hypothetical protein